MNQSIFEGIRGDNENFIVLLYDFDLCQNSAHVKLHSSKAEQCEPVKSSRNTRLLLIIYIILDGLLLSLEHKSLQIVQKSRLLCCQSAKL